MAKITFKYHGSNGLDHLRAYYLAEFHGHALEVDIYTNGNTWFYVKETIDQESDTYAYIRKDECGYWHVGDKDYGPYPTRLTAFMAARLA